MILRVKTLIVHIRGGRGRGGWVSTISNSDECKVNLCETVCLVILNLLNKVCSIDMNINPYSSQTHSTTQLLAGSQCQCDQIFFSFNIPFNNPFLPLNIVRYLL